jgi:excisionase family DNA binding protein
MTKSTTDTQLLTALQETISTTLREWLDNHKSEVLSAIADGLSEREIAKEAMVEQNKAGQQLLTPEDLARRWGLHQESVRRKIRMGEIPRMIIGRRVRVALAEVEAFEKAGRIQSGR